MHPQIGDCGMEPYRGVTHIDAVRPYSERSDFEVMSGIFRIIREAGMQDYLGVSLLHVHHPLEVDEFWLERAEGAHVVSRPTRHCHVEGEVHPMMWRLVPEIDVQPVHWRAGFDTQSERVAKFFKDAIWRLRDVLGLEANRFGIVRPPISSEFKRGRKLRERSITASRTLVSEWCDTLKDEGAISTAWFASAPQDGLNVGALCYPFSQCIVERDGTHREVKAHDVTE